MYSNAKLFELYVQNGMVKKLITVLFESNTIVSQNVCPYFSKMCLVELDIHIVFKNDRFLEQYNGKSQESDLKIAFWNFTTAKVKKAICN